MLMASLSARVARVCWSAWLARGQQVVVAEQQQREESVTH